MILKEGGIEMIRALKVEGGESSEQYLYDCTGSS